MIYSDYSPAMFAAPISFTTDTTQARISMFSTMLAPQALTVFTPPPPPPEPLPLPPQEFFPPTEVPLPIPGFEPLPPAPPQIAPDGETEPPPIFPTDLPPQEQFDPSPPPPPVPTTPPQVLDTFQVSTQAAQFAPTPTSKLKPILIGGGIVLGLAAIAVFIARR